MTGEAAIWIVLNKKRAISSTAQSTKHAAMQYADKGFGMPHSRTDDNVPLCISAPPRWRRWGGLKEACNRNGAAQDASLRRHMLYLDRSKCDV